MRNSSSASGSRAFSSRYCCIIGVNDGSLMALDLTEERGSPTREVRLRPRPRVAAARIEPARTVPVGSELVECGLFLGVDFKDLVEPGDPEDLEEIGMDAAELELTLDHAHFLLEVDQLAQRGAGEVLDVAEIEEELLMAFVFDQAIE